MTDTDLDPQSPLGDLDPQDWAAYSRAVNRVLDAAIEKFQSVSDGRVWTPVPDALEATLHSPLPTDSLDLKALIEYIPLLFLFLTYSPQQFD